VEICYRSITHQDSTIIAYKDKIISLKAKISSLKKHLRQVEQDVKLKNKASSIQNTCIIELEDKVSQLKARIRELVSKKIIAVFIIMYNLSHTSITIKLCNFFFFVSFC